MRRAVILALLAGASCNQIFGLKPTALDDTGGGGGGGGGDSAVLCGSAVCEAPMVCDTSNAMCVPCTPAELGACGSAMLVCGSDDMCHSCTTDSQCASDVCLSTGACASAAGVSYVAGSDVGSGGIDPAPGVDEPCSQSRPCATINGALRSQEFDHIIKVYGTVVSSTSLPMDTDVQIIGDDKTSVLAGSDPSQPTVGIQSGANVIIRDLTIDDGNAGISLGTSSEDSALAVLHCTITGNHGVGVEVSAVAPGTIELTVAQSMIAGNQGGGVDLGSVRFELIGNAIVGNGSAGAAVGGVRVEGAPVGGGSGIVAFDTIADNQNSGADTAGIACGSLTLTSDTIVADNHPGSAVGSATQQVDVSSSCAYRYVIAFPAGPIDGSNHDVVANPDFVNEGSGNVRLGSGSPALMAADGSADLTGLAALDPDGVPRAPPPADVGAYQHPR